MEGTTEPIVVVIGHPIAGNPSQFALERSLHAMELDWRVLSFDVQSDDVAAALEGFSVTGIVGVLIDSSVTEAAIAWYARQQPDAVGEIDCLRRDQENRFVASDERLAWLAEQLREHGGENRIRLGEMSDASPALVELAGDAVPTPPNIDTISAANQIFLGGTDESPLEIDLEDWPENDGTTLVIDLTDGHPQAEQLTQLGYRVLSAMDLKIGTLQKCLLSWTGEMPPADVIHDAIEEYLAV